MIYSKLWSVKKKMKNEKLACKHNPTCISFWFTKQCAALIDVIMYEKGNEAMLVPMAWIWNPRDSFLDWLTRIFELFLAETLCTQ
jgi:hypothetical protein